MILLDTHVWLWWISNPEELSDSAREEIGRAALGRRIYLSSISTLEAAMLVSKGRLRLTIDIRDWILKSERLPFFKFVPVDNTIATRSVYLPGPLHSDPADRIIIATAVTLEAVLITKDEKLLCYPHVKTLW